MNNFLLASLIPGLIVGYASWRILQPLFSASNKYSNPIIAMIASPIFWLGFIISQASISAMIALQIETLNSYLFARYTATISFALIGIFLTIKLIILKKHLARESTTSKDRVNFYQNITNTTFNIIISAVIAVMSLP